MGGLQWRLRVALLLALACSTALAEKTTISGTLNRADGRIASGNLLVSWPAFTTAAGDTVTAGTLQLAVPATGQVQVELAPTVGAQPEVYYRVVLRSTDGSASEEYWSVPATSNATLASVRMTGVSAASSTTVDSVARAAVATKADANTLNAHVSASSTHGARGALVGQGDLQSGSLAASLSKLTVGAALCANPAMGANVVCYGADSTGVNDSTAAFTAAYNDAVAQKLGKVFFPAGKFYFAHGVPPISNGGIVIEGMGQYAISSANHGTLIVIGDANADGIVFTGTSIGLSHFGVRHLEVAHTSTAGTGYAMKVDASAGSAYEFDFDDVGVIGSPNGIALLGGQGTAGFIFNGHFRYVNVNRVGGKGLYALGRVQQLQFDRSWFVSASEPVLVDGGPWHEAQDFQFNSLDASNADSSHFCIHFRDALNMQVFSPHMETCGYGGVSLESVRGVRLKGGYLQQFQYGVYLGQGANSQSVLANQSIDIDIDNWFKVPVNSNTWNVVVGNGLGTQHQFIANGGNTNNDIRLGYVAGRPLRWGDWEGALPYIGGPNTATISNVAIAGNTLTVTSSGYAFSPGTQVTLNGLTTATFLNGEMVTVSTGGSTGFTAYFKHADYASADTGTVYGPTPRGITSVVHQGDALDLLDYAAATNTQGTRYRMIWRDANSNMTVLCNDQAPGTNGCLFKGNARFNASITGYGGQFDWTTNPSLGLRWKVTNPAGHYGFAFNSDGSSGTPSNAQFNICGATNSAKCVFFGYDTSGNFTFLQGYASYNSSERTLYTSPVRLNPYGGGVSINKNANPATGTSIDAAGAANFDGGYQVGGTTVIDNTGKLAHGSLPALVSADIPDNAANTSGTAAGLSSASVLPNGTTATTQSAGDNSTKLATTAYVDGRTCDVSKTPCVKATAKQTVTSAANLGATTLFTTTQAGQYSVAVNCFVTAAGSGTLNVEIDWNNGAFADASVPATLNLGSATGHANFVIPVYAAASQAISMKTTGTPGGTPNYACYETVTQVSAQ